jgi:hypothetical protein
MYFASLTWLLKQIFELVKRVTETSKSLVFFGKKIANRFLKAVSVHTIGIDLILRVFKK